MYTQGRATATGKAKAKAGNKRPMQQLPKTPQELQDDIRNPAEFRAHLQA